MSKNSLRDNCLAQIDEAIGKKFGKRKVLRFYGRKDGKNCVECLCDCGKIDIVVWNEIKRNKRLQCVYCTYKIAKTKKYRIQ